MAMCIDQHGLMGFNRVGLSHRMHLGIESVDLGMSRNGSLERQYQQAESVELACKGGFLGRECLGRTEGATIGSEQELLAGVALDDISAL